MESSPVDTEFVRFSEQQSKLVTKHLDEDYVLIQSDSAGLEFLSRVFAAMAREPGSSKQFGPRGAGLAVFGEGAEVGIYILNSDA